MLVFPLTYESKSSAFCHEAPSMSQPKNVKNFQIVFRDGRSQYLAADRYVAAGDTIVFYAAGKIVAAIERSRIGVLREVDPTRTTV